MVIIVIIIIITLTIVIVDLCVLGDCPAAAVFFFRTISPKWQKASGGQWPTFLDLLRPDKSPVQLAKQHVASMLTGESKRLGILAVAACFPHVHGFAKSKPEVWSACRNKFLALSAKLHQQHDAYVKKHEHLFLGDQRVPQGECILKAI